jgi:hypothetical protein
MRGALVILAIGAALLVAARLVHQPQPHATPPAPHKALILGGPAKPAPGQTPPSTPEPEASTPTRASPAATQTARRFITAYLRWAQGGRNRRTLTALQATTSPALWSQLQQGATLPTATAQVPSEQLRRLVAGTAPTGRAATVLAELERRRRLGGLAVVLRHQRHGWRVTALSR